MRDYTLDDLFDAVLEQAPMVVAYSLCVFAFVGLVCLGPWIPFSLFQFWKWEGTLYQVIRTAWPIFAWVGCMTLYDLATDRSDSCGGDGPREVLRKGTIISLWAGISEEIFFRWLMFYTGIIGFKVMNTLTFGLTEWFHVHLYGPMANLFTLGVLHDYLLNGAGYAVGAAIITANGRFQKGHQYQGTFGLINSWFLGMIFFHIMFKHGLLAAMFVHFLYDELVFCAAAGRAYAANKRDRVRR